MQLSSSAFENGGRIPTKYAGDGGLDTTITLPPRMNKEAVLSAIKGHVLAEAEIVATNERK